MRSPQGPDFPNNGSIRVGEGRWLGNQNPRKGRNALNLFLHLPLCGWSIKHRVNAHDLCRTGCKLYFRCVDKLITRENYQKVPTVTYCQIFARLQTTNSRNWQGRELLHCPFLGRSKYNFHSYSMCFYRKISILDEIRKLKNSASYHKIHKLAFTRLKTKS